MKNKNIRVISFLWGLAEATFFFLIPDIWLSRIVLNNKKEAYLNIFIATAGAILGGGIVYLAATAFSETIPLLFDYIPGISLYMMGETEFAIEKNSIAYALLDGMTSGIPYKIVAFYAGIQGVNLSEFIVLSIILRALRFLVVTFLAHLMGIALKHFLSLKSLYQIHSICWGVFYIAYFYHFGW